MANDNNSPENNPSAPGEQPDAPFGDPWDFSSPEGDGSSENSDAEQAEHDEHDRIVDEINGHGATEVVDAAARAGITIENPFTDIDGLSNDELRRILNELNNNSSGGGETGRKSGGGSRKGIKAAAGILAAATLVGGFAASQTMRKTDKAPVNPPTPSTSDGAETNYDLGDSDTETTEEGENDENTDEFLGLEVRDGAKDVESGGIIEREDTFARYDAFGCCKDENKTGVYSEAYMKDILYNLFGVEDESKATDDQIKAGIAFMLSRQAISAAGAANELGLDGFSETSRNEGAKMLEDMSKEDKDKVLDQILSFIEDASLDRVDVGGMTLSNYGIGENSDGSYYSTVATQVAEAGTIVYRLTDGNSVLMFKTPCLNLIVTNESTNDPKVEDKERPETPSTPRHETPPTTPTTPETPETPTTPTPDPEPDPTPTPTPTPEPDPTPTPEPDPTPTPTPTPEPDPTPTPTPTPEPDPTPTPKTQKNPDELISAQDDLDDDGNSRHEHLDANPDDLTDRPTYDSDEDEPAPVAPINDVDGNDVADGVPELTGQGPSKSNDGTETPISEKQDNADPYGANGVAQKPENAAKTAAEEEANNAAYNAEVGGQYDAAATEAEQREALNNGGDLSDFQGDAWANGNY